MNTSHLQKKRDLLKQEIENLKKEKREIKNKDILGVVQFSSIKKEKVKKIILNCFLSPGDIMMLTATVRDLHKAHPGKFITYVHTACNQIWENNPNIIIYNDKDPETYSATKIICKYPLIHQSNTSAYHFIHGFHKFLEEKLQIPIPCTDFKGDIYISDKEKSWMSQVEENFKYKGKFWIIMAGGKFDFTCKFWAPDYYQEVVDHFKGKLQFIQCGDKNHYHPPLKNVINLIGQTDARQFIRLVYHSSGILCPVTFAMHLAAAVPVKDDKPKNRPCVVISGGREPVQWEAYPHHRFLAVNGSLDCCDNGGCWKSRCQKVGDGDEKDEKDLCLYPVDINDKLKIPRCMFMIKPKDVIRAIESYYEGNILKYNGESQ
jgi:ADP-heptose:LPS heptosyltransferase